VPSILLLEPDGLGREHLLAALGAAGHNVTVLEDGRDALTRWRNERHELAVLAEDAPGMSGAEIAARMKAETPHVFAPVLLILANADVDARIAAFAVADDVVSRPFWPAEVHARIEALLRTRHLVDALRVSRAEVEARAGADSATGLRTRAYLQERLNEEWKRAARYNEPLALLLLGLEGLADVDKQRGAAFRTRLLQAIGQLTMKVLRQIDIVARSGESEVAALLPNTHFAGAITCAERLHRALAKLSVEGYTPVGSMGVSFYPGRDVNHAGDLLSQGTLALERARAEGPGNICLVQHQGYLFQVK
jgi:diguanylate cyclase (GGDEF)-like protein